MKSITLALLLAGSALAAVTFSTPSVASSQESGGRAGGDRPQEERGRRGPSELGQFMEKLDEGLATIAETLGGDEVTDEQWAGALAQICELQAGAIAAKSEEPRSFGRMEAEDLAKAKVGYRAEMHALVGQLFELELAVAGGDAKEAQKSLAKFEEVKKSGHTKYKGRRGGGPGGRRDR